MNKQKPLIWINNLVLFGTLAVTVTVVPWYLYSHSVGWGVWLAALLLWAWSGLSITAGYHRLWAHRAWQAHPALQWLLAIGGAMAMQNTILHWCSDHRTHHKHVDNNDRDPYSAGNGFWYSHIGWLLRDHGISDADTKNVRDLHKNPIVQFQHRHYLLLAGATNLGLPLALGWLAGDLWGGLLIAGFLRVVLVHHGTFFINSLAHIWGSQPYSDAHSSRDNGLLALLTFGEGYHNFHHSFEYDYRNGVRWWQFDPTKWLIQLAYQLRLASGLRRTPQERIEKARLTMQLRRSQLQFDGQQHAAELLARLEQEYEQLAVRLQAYYQQKQRLLQANKRRLDRSAKQQLRELKQALELQRQQWLQLRQQLHAMA
ncbi:fatty acid desaturase [Ferrimonas senticii]|uniref:fatty acid desaturase n=1 Tax=Ferrimonas senticii TaxID=394566 RepID=UPI0004051B31|nr:fatty acid desaturase [Ferrimonas senticii]